MPSEKRTQKTAIYICAILTLAGLSVAGSPAFAQLDQQTGTAEPGRAGQQIFNTINIPDLQQPTLPATPETPSLPEGADSIKFKLNAMEIKGGTVYTEKQLSEYYAGKIGKVISLRDLYMIAHAITVRYRNDGFILSKAIVPPQIIERGTGTIQIIEGYAADVQIDSNLPERELNKVRDYANKIKKDRPLNIATMERALLLIGDLPGLSAHSLIKPGTKIPNTADILLFVEKDSLHGAVTANNYGSRYLGPVQTSAALTLNSPLGFNEEISVIGSVAPGDDAELSHGGINASIPINSSGTKLTASASHTATDPGYTLEAFDVSGNATSVGVGVLHPFIRRRHENLYGSLNFEGRRISSNNNVDFKKEDEIRALRGMVKYEFVDQFLSLSSNAVYAEVSQGLGILGASDDGDPNMSRADANPQFTKIKVGVTRLQKITDNISLLAIAQGQAANDSLPASEEFGIGGISSVRGYSPSELIGDDGVSGNLELRWTDLVNDTPYIDQYRLYSFLDGGTIWNKDATTSADKRETLTSAGAGIKVDMNEKIGANVDMTVAFPLNREVETKQNKSPTFYFNVVKDF